MKIGFIGAGRMAQALAGGIAKSGICLPEDMTISDPNIGSIEAFRASVGDVEVAADNQTCAASRDYLILAVKPQVFESAATMIDLSDSNCTVVSVMGGIKIQQIGNLLGTENIIRVMPNTPCLVGEGACGVATTSAVEPERVETVTRILASLGIVVSCPESQLDAVTGLSGSGPAYVFSFIEALADGGVLNGLSRQHALKLAAQTVFGAAKMLLESEEHPAELRDRVTSPGGTTIHGLQALEDGGFRATVMSAVQAATERSNELGS